MKKLNERCPLQNECERVCKFEKQEHNCEYYRANSRPGYEIDDQETRESIDVVEESYVSGKTGALVYIEVSKLHPHYDNPRKDLGDLTELAESIKSNGILQNLTVVPWFSKITGVGADDPKQQEELGYIVIIGHRRLAAAKLAGLTEVPCTIANMTIQEQVATMLLENMQRSDLTIWEQAQGFQMMLDLGETVNNISEKTGFSETTVRRRVKLLDLDKDKFKESVERGATLMDYAELDKIHDIGLRNSVLEKIGTPNFRYELQRAIDKEKGEENTALLIAELEKFATQVKETNGLKWVRSYYTSQKPDITVPDDADTVEYFFQVSQHGYITLYQKYVQSEASVAQEEKQKEIRERQAALDEISKRAYQLRRDFIRDISNTKAKKNIGIIIENAIYAMVDSYNNAAYDDLAEFFDIKLNDEDEWKFEDIVGQLRQQPELYLLITTYCMVDGSNMKYFDWNANHKSDEDLDRVYDFLEKLGYEMSDEEVALRDGTHKLFKSKDEAN